MAELPSHTRRPAGDPRVFARTSIARLFELVRAERDHLRLIVIYAFGVGILAIATPVAVQSLVNFVAFGGVMQPIIVLSALLFGSEGDKVGEYAVRDLTSRGALLTGQPWTRPTRRPATSRKT